MKPHAIWPCLCATTCVIALFVVSGCVAPRLLIEPTRDGDGKTCAATVAPRTITIPVAYDPPDAELQISVTGRDFLDNPVTLGYFRAGEIIARRFGDVARANFGEPSSDVPPIGRFIVRIDSVMARRPSGGNVSVSVGATVSVSSARSSEIAYQKGFRAERSAAWGDESAVPGALYDALDKLVHDFLEDWSTSSAVSVLSKWADEATPGIRPPELVSLDFVEQGKDVYCGSCTVACNDYEGFRAKGWADAQIEQACRRKLGIEPERVRIVYDAEKFDPSGKTWRLEFRTFARTKMVLTFSKATRHGFATGDLGLMVMSADMAAEELRRFVHSEMDARAGAVSSGTAKGEAMVRFDDFKTDPALNLITISFRLVN